MKFANFWSYRNSDSSVWFALKLFYWKFSDVDAEEVEEAKHAEAKESIPASGLDNSKQKYVVLLFSHIIYPKTCEVVSCTFLT